MIPPANPDYSYFGGCHTPHTPPEVSPLGMTTPENQLSANEGFVGERKNYVDK
jgi:hypothetical protein